jgi:hypothetical protein
MVRRGSTVRVRQRAPEFPRNQARSGDRTEEGAPSEAGFGNVARGAFRRPFASPREGDARLAPCRHAPSRTFGGRCGLLRDVGRFRVDEARTRKPDPRIPATVVVVTEQPVVEVQLIEPGECRRPAHHHVPPLGPAEDDCAAADSFSIGLADHADVSCRPLATHRSEGERSPRRRPHRRGAHRLRLGSWRTSLS